MLRAVFFDFGGVILSSPFEAFNHYEAAQGLPANFIRSVNSVNPDDNAWAKLERSDISPAEFDDVFARALKGGAKLVKIPEKVFWGGYSGYYADPDGHVWEVAHNPFWELNPDGSLTLPAK